MISIVIAVASLLGGETNTITAVAPCAVQGVWMLESVTSDGKAEPLGKRRQIKILTATHYAWMSQEPGPTALRSPADSLAAYRTSGFGGGTYRVTDSTYTERLDYFYDPTYLKREVVVGCRMVADRWYATFEWPVIVNGRETRRMRVEEVWRRTK